MIVLIELTSSGSGERIVGVGSGFRDDVTAGKESLIQPEWTAVKATSSKSALALQTFKYVHVVQIKN